MIHRIYNSKTHVLLDNGHGIDTPGKRSPVFADGTQLFEYEFNRDIVSKISGYLNFCNENKKQFIYLVSIHGNAAKNPSANGIEVWTSKGKAILTENGFYTNYDECKRMSEFYWRQQIALAHVRAINKIDADYAKK